MQEDPQKFKASLGYTMSSRTTRLYRKTSSGRVTFWCTLGLLKFQVSLDYVLRLYLKSKQTNQDATGTEMLKGVDYLGT